MTSLARIVTGPDDAPTLVLLHGITGSAVSLAEAIDHWVGRGYRVVAVDARGHGLSPRWEPAELERAGEVLVEDLIAVAADQNFVPVVDDKDDFIGIVTRSRILKYCLEQYFVATVY